MVENVTSQVQQGFGMWKKAWDDHVTRVNALFTEVNKLEQKNVEQFTNAVDEAAKMTRENLAYATQLASEWRKLSLEATKKAASFVTGSGS